MLSCASYSKNVWTNEDSGHLLRRLSLSAIISLHASTFQDYPVYEDRDTFYPALAAFVQDGDNARFLSDIRYDEDGVIAVRAFGLDVVEAFVLLSGAENGPTGCIQNANPMQFQPFYLPHHTMG